MDLTMMCDFRSSPITEMIAVFALLLLGGHAKASISETAVRVRATPIIQSASRTLYFEPNCGQFDPQVRYVARAGSFSVWLADLEVVLDAGGGVPDGGKIGPRRELSPKVSVVRAQSERAVVRMTLLDSSAPTQWEHGEDVPGYSNYFLGNEPANWRTHVPHYAWVKARGVYPGVDLRYHQQNGSVEYDFEVAPGADPSQIRLHWDGAQAVAVNQNGDLAISIGQRGSFIQKRPVVYQLDHGSRRLVPARYSLSGGHTASIVVDAYDKDLPIVIDPVIAYATYIGGSLAEQVDAVTVDSTGAAYVVGGTSSSDFPTKGGYQKAEGLVDAFVMKIAPDGASIVYSTYIGGKGTEIAYGVGLDQAGTIYVTGGTGSADFPTKNPAQTYSGKYDAFVTAIQPNGDALVYSTYYGGTADDSAAAIAVSPDGMAYVAGVTTSSDIPTVSPLMQKKGGTDAFVAAFSVTGRPTFSTYLGGSDDDSASGIAVGTWWDVYVTGTTLSSDFPVTRSISKFFNKDAFVGKIIPFQSKLVYLTYLGGSGIDEGAAIAVDSSGAAYVTGSTYSKPFPNTLGFPGGDLWRPDAFVAKINPAGDAVVYATQIGGTSFDYGYAVAAHPYGGVYVAGETLSSVAGSVLPPKGDIEAFLTKVDKNGAIAYFTYLGGSRVDRALGVAADRSGSAYVVGETWSGDMPVVTPVKATNEPGWQDGLLVKVIDAEQTGPAICDACVYNGAGFHAGLAPNSWITIKGLNLASSTETWSGQIVDGKLPTTLGGVSVTVDGKPAYVSYVSPGQINALAPDVGTGAVQVKVTNAGKTSDPVVAYSQPFQPAFFMVGDYALATRPDYSLVAKNGAIPGVVTQPAKPGEVVVLWGTGFGPTVPPAPIGAVIPGGAIYSCANPVAVEVGGKLASVLGAAMTPGSAGLFQIAIRIPESVPDGDLIIQAQVSGYGSPAARITIQH